MPFVQRVIEPKFLSRTSLFDDDGKARVSDDELTAVTNNTLSNALRQLASLALVANDIFVELTRQLQTIAQRSDCLKGKIDTLEQRVTSFDPKKVAVPVSDICTFANLKEHYQRQHGLDTNLFSANSRPSAVQALYETAAKTPIALMRQMDRWRRDGHRSSRFFVCTPVLGNRRRKFRSKIDIDIETRLPAAVEELRRWTSTEALGDITVAPDCPNRIVPNTTFSDGNLTDGTIASDDEAIDHKLPSPEEQVQVVALKFPAEVVAVDVSGRVFNRMSIQRRSLLHGDVTSRTEDGSSNRRHTRTRKPRNRRRNTLAGTDQKEIQNAVISGEVALASEANLQQEPVENRAVFRSKSSEPLRNLPKKDSPSLDGKKSHFHTLKQWGKNRLKMINNKSGDSKQPPSETNKVEDADLNIYETVTLKRKRGLCREKRVLHERKPSYSSSEKSSINLPITTPLSAAMSIAVKLRESSAQRRLRRSGGNKDEPHSSSGNWSASSESGRASIGSEITSTTQPKSSTSAATSNNSLNQHLPSSVNSRRKFNINTSGSSSITSEGTLTPDIHDFHEDGETSSVYSCDTEGYYTSFHMDSGLKTLKEEEMPPTPLHSTTAFSHSSSGNTVLSAENEYELFGKGSTSTTASSAGTVCTTLKANGSSRSLTLGPAVPERKSSLSQSTKDKSPGSSLEREFCSEKTGTVKRSPASSNKSSTIAIVHKPSNGDVSPDSGHNTSSSPIDSANSPNGVRSGSEFEFSECSDMEGPDRIERIRVKTTINSSRIPSMCVITPPHSDDESVKSHNYEDLNNRKNFEHRNFNMYQNRRLLNIPLKPMETDLDKLEFADSENDDPLSNTRVILTSSNGVSKLQLINVNAISGYATVENVGSNEPVVNQKNSGSSARAASPSGGTLVIKEETKPQSQPIFKQSLLPFNNVFGKIKSNFIKKEAKPDLKNIDDDGDYVTIADVRNNNKKGGIEEPNSTKPFVDMEYVSLNELPFNATQDAASAVSVPSNANDSLERKRRQGARVTLDAEGKVVYSSDSLRRRKGAHTTFEPGPYVKEQLEPRSPLPTHRTPISIRPVGDSRPLSPQLEKLVIRAASGTSSPTSEVVRVPPSTIVTPAMRPLSPNVSSRGAYVHMQEAQGPMLSPSGEKEPMQQNMFQTWGMESGRPLVMTDAYDYPNPPSSNTLLGNIQTSMLPTGIHTYKTLPCRKPQYISDHDFERPITPDIMRGLPNDQTFISAKNSPSYNYKRCPELPRQYQALKLGIPVQLPQVADLVSTYSPQVPCLNQQPNPIITQYSILQSKHFHSSTPTNEEKNEPKTSLIRNISPVTSQITQQTNKLNDSLKISPIDPRNVGGFQSSTPSATNNHQELKYAMNLESKLLSPKKSTMSTDELYAVIHKGKKKLNIETADLEESLTQPPTPESKIKTPESGYLASKTRSRFSWSPSDGEYVDYNTNIDKLTPSPEAPGARQGRANDRKGNPQTSRLDFKKLLLQQSVKANVASPGSRKLTAVEQLKLSREQVPASKSPQPPEMNILDLTSSPRNRQNRRIINPAPGSPKHGPDKQRPVASKLMSPRSQWRFTNPRSDVLSSTIPEDCREDENSPSGSLRQKSLRRKPELYGTSVVDSPTRDAGVLKSKTNLPPDTSSISYKNDSKTSKNTTTSISQYIRNQRANFFGSSPNKSNPVPPSSINSGGNSKENKACLSPPALETAF